MTNCIPVEKFSLFRAHFLYVDGKDYFANKVFYQCGLRVKVHGDFVKDGEYFKCVRCSVKKKDVELFKVCMEELERAILLEGHMEYVSFCMELFDNLVEVNRT